MSSVTPAKIANNVVSSFQTGDTIPIANGGTNQVTVPGSAGTVLYNDGTNYNADSNFITDGNGNVTVGNSFAGSLSVNTALQVPLTVSLASAITPHNLQVWKYGGTQVAVIDSQGSIAAGGKYFNYTPISSTITSPFKGTEYIPVTTGASA